MYILSNYQRIFDYNPNSKQNTKTLMPYTKRTKTKESKGISSLLQSSAKNVFLSQAYFFSVVNKSIASIFETEYPKLVEDLKLCEIFVKHETDGVKIIIQSSDISFLTWLKTEGENIKDKLFETLVEKKLLKDSEGVVLVGKRK